MPQSQPDFNPIFILEQETCNICMGMIQPGDCFKRVFSL